MEIRKEVPEFENYEASTLGRVRSKSVGKIKKPQKRRGYLRLKIWSKKDKKQKTRYLHQLVLRAHTPKEERNECIDHIDNNPLNNKVENLQRITFKGNSEKMRKQLRHYTTPCKGTNKETGEVVHYNSIAEAGRGIGGSSKCIQSNLAGRTKSSYGRVREYIEI